MTNSFWFSNNGDVALPAVEPAYNIEESSTADESTRTFESTDGSKVGETGVITDVTYNLDETQTLTVEDGFEPHQSLVGGYLVVGDTVTQDEEGAVTAIATSAEKFFTGGGLRFDSTRNTNLRLLSNSLSGAFTFSCWYKMTNASGAKILLGASGSAYLNVIGDVYSFNGSAFSGSPQATLNEWQHVVCVFETTGATLYVNGVQSGTVSSNTRWDGIYIGDNGSLTQNLNGYLSEVYLSETALLPTVFAESNSDGEWIPLSSDVVEENISNGVIQPYDYRANTDQVWSAGTDPSDWNQPITNLFDGSLDTRAYANAPGGATCTWNSIEANTSIRVWGYQGSDGNWQLVINGSNVNIPFSTNEDWVTMPVTYPCQLSGVYNNGDASARAIEVDGRLLVDTGVWDASQNWTGDATITGPTSPDAGNYGPWKYGFDGNENTFVETSSTTKLVFATPVPFSSLQVKATGTYKINDTSVTASGVGSGSAIFETPAGITSPISSIELLSSSSLLLGVKVDGAILVDEGAQWNTSQVWSSNTTGSWDSSNPATNAFDGGFTTIARNVGGQMAAVSFPTISGVTSLVLWGAVDTTNGTIEVETTSGVFVDVSNEFTAGSGDTETVTLPASITSISGVRLNSNLTAGNPRIAGIKVNGEVLVDQGSFGANGFYLPFDTSNTGAIYTGSYTGSPFEGDWNTIFNGVKGANSASTVSTFTSSGDTTMTLTTPFSGNLTVYASANSGTGDPTGSEVVLTTGSGSVSVPCAVLATGNPAASHGINVGAVSNVTAITLKQATLGTKLYWLELDGNLLVDHSNISVDASGNQNNFIDQNFALNTTGDIYTGPFVSTNETVLFDGGLFNGVLSTSGSNGIKFDTQGSTATATMTLTSPITTTGTITVAYNGTGSSRTIQFNNESAQTFITGSGADIRYATLSCPTTITEISFAGATGQGAGAMIGALFVNGVALTDANLQDTVTDTPGRNYAVLTSGVNGNLATTANTQAGTTSTLSATGKVYAEAKATLPSVEITISVKNNATTVLASIANRVEFEQGDIVGVAVDEVAGNVSWFVNGTFVRTDTFDTSGGVKIGGNSGNTGTTGSLIFNFGQQPFAASNVVYDQETGIATVSGVDYNTLSEVLVGIKDQKLTFASASEIEGVFVGDVVRDSDGDESTVTDISGTVVTTDKGASFEDGDTVIFPGQGVGTITAINTLNNTVTVGAVSSRFIAGQNRTLRSGTARHGALAVSDTATSVEEVEFDYNIEGSLRFDSASTPYLSRTPAVEGDRKTWTWSGWVKRSTLGTGQNVFGSNNLWFELQFTASNQLQIYWETGGTGSNNLISDAVYRDLSAWMHIVLKVDTTHSTESDRVQVYVNGSLITWSSASYPSQNYDTGVNSTNAHGVGIRVSGTALPFDGYLADVRFIDGQAITPDKFAFEVAGWWLPKAYTGSYGANGFYLPFDPEATGVIYSSETVLGAGVTGDGKESLFDGTSTSFFKLSGGATNTGFAFTPTSTITGSTVKIRVSTQPSVTCTLFVNGSPYETSAASSTEILTADLGSSTIISSIELKRASGTDFYGAYYIEVNGKLLADHSSIGVDVSGNGNVFQDHNFGVGNTSQVWSDYLVSSNGGFTPSSPETNGFNGAVGDSNITQAVAGASPNSITFTPVGGIPYTSSVEVHITNAENQVSINGGALQTIATDSYVQIASGSGTINNIVFQRASTNGASFAGIRVDGVLLVDPNEQDTVVDSPSSKGTDNGLGGEVIGNYATLNPLNMVNGGSSTISNGNTKIVGGSTNGAIVSTINPRSGKYYLELGIKYASGQSQANTGIGVVGEVDPSPGNPSGDQYPATFCGFFARTEINTVLNGSENGDQVTEPTTSYMIGLHINYDDKVLTQYIDGVEGNSVSFSSISTPLLYFNWGNTVNTMNVNFGQKPWAYAPPAGYKCLVDTNL